jgi:hypothetical protein
MEVLAEQVTVAFLEALLLSELVFRKCQHLLVVVVAQVSKIMFLVVAELVGIVRLAAEDLEQAVNLEELLVLVHLVEAAVVAVELIMQVLAVALVDMSKLLLLHHQVLILGLLVVAEMVELLVVEIQVQVVTEAVV